MEFRVQGAAGSSAPGPGRHLIGRPIFPTSSDSTSDVGAPPLQSTTYIIADRIPSIVVIMGLHFLAGLMPSWPAHNRVVAFLAPSLSRVMSPQAESSMMHTHPHHVFISGKRSFALLFSFCIHDDC
ncbi:hypothetical protein MN608_09660 [Microdochium nivale]|nr:hypothetical protein MN608_09660 [Microdochium nivale]